MRPVPDVVHVWRASLDVAPSSLEALATTLSPDESARAARFARPMDRDRYVAARGILRDVLGRYMGRPAAAVRIRYGPHGKPELERESDAPRLQFNLSHAAGLALFAVADSRRVGVDVERVDPALAKERIPEQFFSPREVTALRALPAALQPEAFFTCWTRKEAYVKARGAGLSLRLDQFDVALAPGEPAALLRTDDDPLEAARWSLWALTPGPGYVGALAVEGSGASLELREWEAGPSGR